MMWLFNPYFLFFWIGSAWLIGILGKHRRYGFLGNFLISFLFSPVVGIIVLLASDDRYEREPRRLR